MENVDTFEEQLTSAPSAAAGGLVVDVDGFEGPLDLLLSLARDQKVDITRISIVALADQYLEWVAAARQSNLELAADYLVMAAWLAYLKSRLLLPNMSSEEEPTGEELAAALAFHLRRLEAMQEAGSRLMARPQLGIDFFVRGEPDRANVVSTEVIEISLYDLLKAYGDHTARNETRTLRIAPSDLFSPEDAIRRLRGLIGNLASWANLRQFVPDIRRGDRHSALRRRSALASTFVAALQLTKEGRLRLRQNQNFGPIFMRGHMADVAGAEGIAGEGAGADVEATESAGSEGESTT